MNYGIFQEALIASLHGKPSPCLSWDHVAIAEGRTRATTAALVVTLLHALAQQPLSSAPAGCESESLHLPW